MICVILPQRVYYSQDWPWDWSRWYHMNNCISGSLLAAGGSDRIIRLYRYGDGQGNKKGDMGELTLYSAFKNKEDMHEESISTLCFSNSGMPRAGSAVISTYHTLCRNSACIHSLLGEPRNMHLIDTLSRTPLTCTSQAVRCKGLNRPWSAVLTITNDYFVVSSHCVLRCYEVGVVSSLIHNAVKFCVRICLVFMYLGGQGM